MTGEEVQLGVKTKIAADWWGARLLAIPENVVGEVVTYYRPNRLISKTYTKANRNDEADTGVLDKQTFQITHQHIVKVEFESFDEGKLKSASEVRQFFVNSLAQAMIYNLDAEFFSAILNYTPNADQEPIGANLVIANANTATTDAQFRENRLKLKDALVDLSATFTSKIAGVSSNDAMAILHPKFATRLNEGIAIDSKTGPAFTNLQGDTRIQSFQGIPIVEHPLLSKNLPVYPANTATSAQKKTALDSGAVSQEKGHNLSTLNGILMTSGAVLFAQSTFTNWSAIKAESGNTIVGIKYNYEFHVAFPELVKRVTTA